MVGEPRDSGSSGGIFFLAAQACPDYCKAIDDSRCRVVKKLERHEMVWLK
jgi:hypothetical protein